MLGQFNRTASGRNSYEIYEANGGLVFKIVEILQEQFGFTSRLPVFGAEEIYIDCKSDDTRLTVGWDQWSGCFVMACDEPGDEVVQQVGDYINSLYDDYGLM